MNLPADVDDERAWIHACACGKRSCSKKSVKKRPSAAPQGGKATAKLVSKKTRRGRKAATSMELELPSDNQEDDTLFLVVPATDIDTASEDEDEEIVKGTGFHHVAEIYSPPRVVPVCNRLGLVGTMSIDLETGYNLVLEETRMKVELMLDMVKPLVLITSAPCAWYSQLNHLFNIPKMDPLVKQQRDMEARTLFLFGLKCCQLQADGGRFYVHEHPDGAKSWKLPEMLQHVQAYQPMFARFDQCEFGLVSKVKRKPMKKGTKLMTNSKHVFQMFDQHFCSGHDHQPIIGQEGGINRSRWAQKYPPAMVSCLAEAVAAHADGLQLLC